MKFSVVIVYKRLLARIRYNRKFALHPGVLRVSEEGLQLERYKLRGAAIELEPVFNFRWSDVCRICGFKRDLYSVDLICLAFQIPDKVFEINEEMEGYHAIIETMPVHFPGLEPQWWTKIALPSFATNLTTIWEKRAPPGTLPNTALQPIAEKGGG